MCLLTERRVKRCDGSGRTHRHWCHSSYFAQALDLISDPTFKVTFSLLSLAALVCRLTLLLTPPGSLSLKSVNFSPPFLSLKSVDSFLRRNLPSRPPLLFSFLTPCSSLHPSLPSKCVCPCSTSQGPCAHTGGEWLWRGGKIATRAGLACSQFPKSPNGLPANLLARASLSFFSSQRLLGALESGQKSQLPGFSEGNLYRWV